MAYERLFGKLTKENLWIYVLKMLDEKPDYVPGLKARIAAEFGFQPAAITFYFVLYKLEQEKLTSSRKEGGKRVYSCTDEGRRELGRAVELLATMAGKLRA
ncbi:MAG: helix-turn-helix transcriptional regulator [Nitrososphaerota archaeon]|nr:helix-turn-helix transcriptional regulator [Nitrososphaerota archaeon]MDG6939781.1 helix-turn-helix transcriptional regulator [Nitrososphaerota archaeon]